MRALLWFGSDAGTYLSLGLRLVGTPPDHTDAHKITDKITDQGLLLRVHVCWLFVCWVDCEQ